VKESYWRSETAPKSLRVYRTISSEPAAQAGRSCGRTTRQNVCHGPLPRLRAASSIDGSRRSRLARAARRT
jgi:hypothetical protein